MKGILLINTGSPVSSKRRDVKAFVGAMLSDPMVLTVPNWFRPILVKGIILPFRQFRSTTNYSLIWDHERDTSPLLYHMEQMAKKLEVVTGMPAEVGMRYEEPSITRALDRLKERQPDLKEVIVAPLFPHYAESSYGTVIKEVKVCLEKGDYPFELRFVEPYFNHPKYIHALAESIKPYVANDFDKLIFNYHSLPLSHVKSAAEKGKEFDYVFQTKETTKLVLAELKMDKSKIRQVYSSAMGRKWLEPSLDDAAETLAKEGHNRLLVVSPGFSVDNLETLFDIGIQATNIYKKAGGKQIEMIPCLNSKDVWIEALQEIIR